MSDIKRIIAGVMSLFLATSNISMVFANPNETTQLAAQTQSTQKKYMKVNASNLNIRSTPSTSAKKLGSLKRGTKVEVIEQSGIWYKINYKNGYGWCSGDYLVPENSSSSESDNNSNNSNNNNNNGSSSNEGNQKKYMQVNASNLNVRSTPSTSAKKLGSLKRGAKVEVIEQSGIWYKINYKNGYGWCSGDYLVPEGSSGGSDQTNNNLTKGHYIVVKTSNNTMAYYKDGKLVSEYRVATGKKSTQTPKGKFKVVNKIVNRPYYKGNIPGGDPRNPLGNRWLGLQVGSTYGTTYAIHGNNNPSSIGTSVSGGCIRMYNDEIKWLYEQVPIGTYVIISSSNQTFKQIANSYKINVE